MRFMTAACYKIFRAYFQAPEMGEEVVREGGTTTKVAG